MVRTVAGLLGTVWNGSVPVGRAPALVPEQGERSLRLAGGREGAQQANASTCSVQISLVSPRFEPRLVTLEPSGPGVVQTKGIKQLWTDHGQQTWARGSSGFRNDFKISGPMDPEHAEPLGSLGLNGAGDDPADEITPTGGEDV
ncbi:hypothetical protein F511_13833 [Dorcoceras hygrometricum]|uniref:Uncharacterized protein n=1 Tax=Dorcoceras hygrometricum TaxID=472368 RepID=A0A2Z7D4Y9_9LAMI|nr:hypothetical protein F511_13833 [Dorcoceras hygrometricum]